MKAIALAVQAVSVCDRLERGIKDGDEESIRAVREMVARWAGAEFEQCRNFFAMAFRALMKKCSEGTDTDLAVAMMAIKCMAEQELARAFDNPEEW